MFSSENGGNKGIHTYMAAPCICSTDLETRKNTYN